MRFWIGIGLFFCFAAQLAAQNRSELGYQTTGRGIVWYRNGLPTHKPQWRLSQDTNKVMWVDTFTTLRYDWSYKMDVWYTKGTSTAALPPKETVTSGSATIDNRTAFWLSNNILHYYSHSDTAFVPFDALIVASAAPSNIAAGGSNAAAKYTTSLWQDKDDHKLYRWDGAAWVEVGTGAADNWGTQVVQRDSSLQGNGTTASPLGVKGYGAASNGQVPSKATGGITWITPLMAEVDGDPLNEAWTIDGDDPDSEVISNQVVKFQGGGINATDYDPVTNTLLITGTELDGSPTNELQTIDVFGISGTILSLSLSSDPTTNTVDFGNMLATRGVDSAWVKYSGSYLNKRITDAIYRNGTTGLRTNDTSGVLNIWAVGRKKLLVFHDPDATGAFLWKYNNAITNRADVNAVIYHASSNNPGGIGVTDTDPNTVYLTGYNVAIAANSEITGPSLFDSYETNWWLTSVMDNTTRNVFERHWIVIDSAAYQHRPLTGVFEKRANGWGALQTNVTRFQVNDWYYGQDGTFNVNRLSETQHASANIFNDSLYAIDLSNISASAAAYFASANDDDGGSVSGKGTSLVLAGKGSFLAQASIIGEYTTTNPNSNFDLILATQGNNSTGVQVKRVWIRSGTNTLVGINNSNPLQMLDVNGTALIRAGARINMVGDSAALTLKHASTQTSPIFRTQFTNGTLAMTAMLYDNSTFPNTTTNSNLVVGRSGTVNAAAGGNTVFGITSAQFGSGITNNTLFGYLAGNALNGGSDNVCIGRSSGAALSTGFQNIMIGSSAGAATNTGSQNTFIGRRSGTTTTDGTTNVGIGLDALRLNVSGDGNVAIGSQAGDGILGDNNVVLGQAAGRLITGSGNILLGRAAGELLTSVSNTLIIDNSNTSAPLIGGDLSSNEVSINLDPASAARSLDVNGEVRIRDLTTDTPTKIVGADADGDLDTVGIGAEAELHLTNGTLGTNFHTTISPSQLTATQNDWNPTGLSTAWIIRLSGDASFRLITGIVAPSFAKRLILHNTGSDAILLPTQHTGSSAANRFNFGRDVILFGGKSIEIVYDPTTSRWRLLSKAGIYDDVEQNYINYKFVSPVSTTSADYDFWEVSSTAASSLVAPQSGLFGGVSVNTGTSSTGNGYVASKEDFFYTGNSADNATWAYAKAVIITPSSLSDGSNEYTLRIGFLTDAGGGNANDGVYFRYTHSLSSGQWAAVTTAGGSSSATSSGVTVSASSIYLLEVYYLPNTTTRFFINGSLVATNTSLIPVNDEMKIIAEIEKSVGTSQRDFSIHNLTTSVAIVH